MTGDIGIHAAGVIAAAKGYEIRRSSAEDVAWAAALGAKVYGGVDVIPEATMLAWHRANPNGFFTFWYEGRRVGNVDLLPLRADVMRRFVQGELLERDVAGEDIVCPTQTSGIRDVHWESIVLVPEVRGAPGTLLRLFAASFPQMLSCLCPLEQIGSIYAIAASDKGERLLRRMGLLRVADAAGRLDGHPLYRGSVASYHAAVGWRVSF